MPSFNVFYDVFVMEVKSPSYVNIKTFVRLFLKVLDICVGLMRPGCWAQSKNLTKV